MSSILQSPLEFIHWQEEEVPENRSKLLGLISTQGGTDERPQPGVLPLFIRIRFRILDPAEKLIFSCLAEKRFDLYEFRNAIDLALILKLIIETNIGFDIDFNLKKIGTSVEFARLPDRDNREFVDDAKSLTQQLIKISDIQ